MGFSSTIDRERGRTERRCEREENEETDTDKEKERKGDEQGQAVTYLPWEAIGQEKKRDATGLAKYLESVRSLGLETIHSCNRG